MPAELLKGFQRPWTVASVAMPKTTDPRELLFFEDFAYRLRLAVEAVCAARRIQKGEVADAIGVSAQRMANWYTMQNRPDWFSVAKFSRRFGISVDWLLWGDEAGLRTEWASLAKAAEERSEEPQGQAGPEPGKVSLKRKRALTRPS